MYDEEFCTNYKAEIIIVLSEKLCFRDEKHGSIRNDLHVVMTLNNKHQLTNHWKLYVFNVNWSRFFLVQLA